MAHSHAHTHANTPCSPQEAEAFLAEAETLVEKKGQKLARIRRKVLQLLLESDEPAKAYDLLANLDGVPLAQPGPPGRDPFSRAAAPLIPPGRGRTGTGRLGSLVPSSAAAAAFIAFDQE